MDFWGLLIVGLLGVLAVVVGLSVHGAYEVISPPRCEYRDDPDAWGLPCQEVEFRATDGVLIRAWLARAPGEMETPAAVIVLHGHGSNRHTTLAQCSFLYPEFTLLLPDLRGHGDSEGRHTSVGYLERLDLIGATRYLRELGYEKVGVLGVSMGAATAILAAAESELIDAVVADSAFAVLRHAVREGARLRGYPGPVTRPLAYLACRTAAWRLRHPLSASDPLGVVGAIAPRPLFLIHGELDDLILVENARALYAAAGEPKELWVLPGVEHSAALEADREAYQERVQGFFQRWLLQEPAPRRAQVLRQA